jgi:hypothetical protein
MAIFYGLFKKLSHRVMRGRYKLGFVRKTSDQEVVDVTNSPFDVAQKVVILNEKHLGFVRQIRK